MNQLTYEPIRDKFLQSVCFINRVLSARWWDTLGVMRLINLKKKS